MTADAINPPRTDLKSRVLDRLRDPTQLRVFVIATVLLVAYAGMYAPLSGKIADTTAEINRQQSLCQLAGDVEHLRTQYQSFADRLPKQSDSKEWVQYLLAGTRRFPLRLTGLDCDPVRDIGPYKAAVLRVELGGGLFRHRCLAPLAGLESPAAAHRFRGHHALAWQEGRTPRAAYLVGNDELTWHYRSTN